MDAAMSLHCTFYAVQVWSGIATLGHSSMVCLYNLFPTALGPICKPCHFNLTPLQKASRQLPGFHVKIPTSTPTSTLNLSYNSSIFLLQKDLLALLSNMSTSLHLRSFHLSNNFALLLISTNLIWAGVLEGA